MKKLIRIALCVLFGIVLIWVFTPQIPAVTVHGESEIYTREDRQSAARLISDTVNSFEGCKLYAVEYEGDEVSQKNLEYCNSLAADGVTYSESIVFTSYFRSPIFNAGAWNPNDLYSWSWYLARTNGGDWEILTYGYA